MDAYRGFVMFLMMAGVLHVGRVAAAFPDSAFWRFLDFHTSHVEWVGCSLHEYKRSRRTLPLLPSRPINTVGADRILRCDMM